LTNPLANDQAEIEAGKSIFESNCITCHGAEGHGDGPATAALDPKSANMADAEMMSDLTDGYIFWRISEGGAFAPINSAMPAWKESPSEEQRWQVISFVRWLSPGQ